MEALADAVGAYPIAFAFGVLVGFYLANRYRLVKRNMSEDNKDGDTKEDRRP